MIADLKPSHPDICYSKYADDLTAVIPAISDLAGSEFGHIQDWSSANRLSINLSKTFVLKVGPSAFHHEKLQALNEFIQQTLGNLLLGQPVICRSH